MLDKTDTSTKILAIGEEGLEALAEHIEKLSRACTILESSRLKHRTILLLLKDMTGLPLYRIEALLDALPELSKRYVKPKKSKAKAS